MKLFSKRHSERRVGPDRISYRHRVRQNELMSTEARNRILAEIKFLSSSDDFLEWHILFEDKREKPSVIYYDEAKIDDFCLAELGYRMSDIFRFDQFDMQQSKQTIRYASDDSDPELYYDDYRLFDLAEITILFSKATERDKVKARINSILKEEETDFEIVEHLITRRNGDDLRGMMGVIKDEHLKTKLERFYEYYSRKDYINAAKSSADIINIVYSDEVQSGKKKQIEAMKVKLSKNLISDNSKDKKERMSKHLDGALRLARSMNNDFYDVRHTERSTLKPHGDNIYKLVATQNLIIIELTLTGLKDDFVLSDDWEHIKAEYIEKYKINIKSRNIYKPRTDDQPIDLSEIPF